VWSPDGKRIVYQQDFGGGEYYDLFAVPGCGGPPLNLTDSPDVSETSPLFSPHGKMLTLSSTDVRCWRIALTLEPLTPACS